MFDVMSGRYSDGGASFDAWLKGHAGDDMRTDRVGRESVYVEKPAVSCAYAIQPDVVRGLLGQKSMRGRGLLGRFLYAMPTTPLGERASRPPSVPEAVKVRYHELVGDLGRLEGEQHVLTLDTDAEGRFQRWVEAVEPRLGPDGDLAHMTDWAGKLCGATLRLAAVLHMAERGSRGVNEPIRAHTIDTAVALGEHLVPHADAVLTMMDAAGAAAQQARQVLRWIRRHEAERFTERDLWRGVKRHFTDGREELDDALANLAERGYIRKADVPAPGRGRPSPAWDVNPATHHATTPRGDKKAKTPTPTPDPSNFGIFGNSSGGSQRNFEEAPAPEPVTEATTDQVGLWGEEGEL